MLCDASLWHDADFPRATTSTTSRCGGRTSGARRGRARRGSGPVRARRAQPGAIVGFEALRRAPGASRACV
ncbi:hypothetical protein NKH77_00090 [Streptomyces sp. M19]